MHPLGGKELKQLAHVKPASVDADHDRRRFDNGKNVVAVLKIELRYGVVRYRCGDRIPAKRADTYNGVYRAFLDTDDLAWKLIPCAERKMLTKTYHDLGSLDNGVCRLAWLEAELTYGVERNGSADRCTIHLYNYDAVDCTLGNFGDYTCKLISST